MIVVRSRIAVDPQPIPSTPHAADRRPQPRRSHTRPIVAADRRPQHRSLSPPHRTRPIAAADRRQQPRRSRSPPHAADQNLTRPSSSSSHDRPESHAAIVKRSLSLLVLLCLFLHRLPPHAADCTKILAHEGTRSADRRNSQC